MIIGNIVLALAGYGLNYLLLWNLFVALLNNLLFFYQREKASAPNSAFDLKFKKETAKLVANFSFGIVGYQILTNFLLPFRARLADKKSGRGKPDILRRSDDARALHTRFYRQSSAGDFPACQRTQK